MTTNSNFQRLLDILSLKRGHNSVGERKFIEQILMPYDPEVIADTEQILAYTITVQSGAAFTPVLYSSHIDTVHSVTQDAKQAIIYDEATEMIYKQDEQPLGADDGAGVWLLLEMIDAGIPGTYIFFRGEERGGIGSSRMAELWPDWFERFDYAIAFDRRDTCSVITHQGGRRCCSEAFATGFAELMGDDRYSFRPDDGGVYTDTAELTHIVPECTNISIGYYSEHSSNEILDVAFLQWMRDRIILQSDLIAQLPVERDPNKEDPIPSYTTSYLYGMDWDYAVPKASATKAKTKAKNAKGTGKVTLASWEQDEIVPQCADDLHTMGYRETIRWVERAAPEDVANLLMDLADIVEYEQSLNASYNEE